MGRKKDRIGLDIIFEMNEKHRLDVTDVEKEKNYSIT